MSVLKTLKQVRALFEDRAKWTQGAFAKNNEGIQVTPHDTDACCWCLVGAIYCHGEVVKTISYLESQIQHQCITKFNDTHTHSEILSLIDRSIKNLES